MVMMQNRIEQIRSRAVAVVIAAGTLALLGASAAMAQNWAETHKLLAGDGAGYDLFGSAVAMADGIVAATAANDDDNGTDSGSAYLFDSTSGNQLTKLLPNDGANADSFGRSISIAEGIVAVGTNHDDDHGSSSGSAYLFDASTANQAAKLLPNDGAAGDEFGLSIAIADGLVAVGAPYDDDNGTDSGSVYLFDVDSGDQVAKLLPDDGEAGERFGHAVAIADGIVAVGAHLDDDNGFRSGSAYLFDASTGVQLHKLLPNNGAADDFFGSSIAIANGIVVVGVRGDDVNGSNSGSAFLFDASNGNQTAELLPDDGAASDFFGDSVAISNGIVAVGAIGDDDNGSVSGSAYLFDDSTGHQIAKLLPSDGAPNDRFGECIAIVDGTVAVGAVYDNDNGNRSGSAYLFARPHLSVTPDPLLDAQDGTFSASTLTPGVNSYLAYSVKGTGSTFIAPLNVTIDLQNPKQAGPTLTSDGDGNVEWDLHLPPVTVPVSIWFQVVQFENKTNVVATTIQP